jgi:hypothetical protein
MSLGSDLADAMHNLSIPYTSSTLSTAASEITRVLKDFFNNKVTLVASHTDGTTGVVTPGPTESVDASTLVITWGSSSYGDSNSSFNGFLESLSTQIRTKVLQKGTEITFVHAPAFSNLNLVLTQSELSALGTSNDSYKNIWDLIANKIKAAITSGFTTTGSGKVANAGTIIITGVTIIDN